MTPPSRASHSSKTSEAAASSDKHPFSSKVSAPLTQTQRRYLRGLCHDLKPVVMLGNKGVTEAVTRELELSIDHHELVKVKLSGGDRDERQQQLDALTGATGAELVQQIGHVVSLFRRNPDKPKLALPR